MNMHKFTNAMANAVIDKYIIEELEKIKSELLSECPNTNARMICMGIIDKHIFKLKEGDEE